MAEPSHEPDRPTPADQPVDALCDDILVRHHAPAHVAIPRIRGHLAALLEQEPGAVPPALPTAFAELADLLLNHLAKEENILFPALVSMAEADRDGRARPLMPFPTVLHPIRAMEAEHARLSAATESLRVVANDFAVGPEASEALRRVMRELAAFRADLLEHLHVENDVLFPRALDLDRRL